MNFDEIEFKKRYLDVLSQETIIKKLNDSTLEIKMPFDKHNDYLQIYVKQEEGGREYYELNYKKPLLFENAIAHEKILKKLRDSGFKGSIDVFKNVISLSATDRNFPLKLREMIQAISTLQYM